MTNHYYRELLNVQSDSTATSNVFMPAGLSFTPPVLGRTRVFFQIDVKVDSTRSTDNIGLCDQYEVRFWNGSVNANTVFISGSCHNGWAHLSGYIEQPVLAPTAWSIQVRKKNNRATLFWKNATISIDVF
jgi:hypothetical protein